MLGVARLHVGLHALLAVLVSFATIAHLAFGFAIPLNVALFRLWGMLHLSVARVAVTISALLLGFLRGVILIIGVFFAIFLIVGAVSIHIKRPNQVLGKAGKGGLIIHIFL
jgi:hypothetical protein